MSLTRKMTLAMALAAPLLFLAPPNAEAQSVRVHGYGQPYAQGYSSGTRYYYYDRPRTRYRGYAPRYYAPGYYRYAPGYYGPYRNRYDRPYGRYYYYAPPRYYRGGGSVWFGF